MRVTANGVLLRTAARMDRLAETLPSKPRGARLAGSMSQNLIWSTDLGGFEYCYLRNTYCCDEANYETGMSTENSEQQGGAMGGS